MEVIEPKHEWVVIIAIVVLAVALALSIESCAPQHYTYKVTFKNGDYEYYDLTYKPKKDAKAIEYDGETLLGIDKIERVK
jgi:hypothetical protein